MGGGEGARGEDPKHRVARHTLDTLVLLAIVYEFLINKECQAEYCERCSG